LELQYVEHIFTELVAGLDVVASCPKLFPPVPPDVPAVEPPPVPPEVPAVEPPPVPPLVPAVEPPPVPPDVPAVEPPPVPPEVPELVVQLPRSFCAKEQSSSRLHAARAKGNDNDATSRRVEFFIRVEGGNYEKSSRIYNKFHMGFALLQLHFF